MPNYKVTLIFSMSLITSIFCFYKILSPKAYDYISVYDGDTIRLHYRFQSKHRLLRLTGFDTPEIRGAGCVEEYKLAIRARDRVRELLETKPYRIILTNKVGYYGRILGSVEVEGKNLKDILISERLARPYSVKEGRKTWCK